MWKMWPKFFFLSDFDENFFGCNSDDFKKKIILKLRKKNCRWKKCWDFLLKCRWGRTCFHYVESSIEKTTRGAARWGVRGGRSPTPIKKKLKKKKFRQHFFSKKCRTFFHRKCFFLKNNFFPQLTGLLPGSLYGLTVVAVNEAGSSAPARLQGFTLPAVPQRHHGGCDIVM